MQAVNAHEASNEISVVQTLAGKPVHRTYKCFDKVRCRARWPPHPCPRPTPRTRAEYLSIIQG